MRKCVPGFLVILALTSWVSTAAAQAPGRLALDVSIGHGQGSTDGLYRDNGAGPAADVVVALRIRPLAGGGLVAALGAGGQGASVHTADCLPDPSGGCVPWFPGFSAFSALVGWETAGGTLRGLIGPAAVHAENTTTAGVTGRIDLSTRLLGPVWLLASARGVLVPDYRGDSFRIGSIGAGFRIR